MANVASYFHTLIMIIKWSYLVTEIISMMNRNTHIFKLFHSKKPYYPEAKLLNLGQYCLQEGADSRTKTKEIKIPFTEVSLHCIESFSNLHRRPQFKSLLLAKQLEFPCPIILCIF